MSQKTPENSLKSDQIYSEAQLQTQVKGVHAGLTQLYLPNVTI